LGAQFIYLLVWLFGVRTSFELDPWLRGPLGSDYIGDQPYEECARDEGLIVYRNVVSGGLIDNFDRMKSDSFEPESINGKIRRFYENTAGYRMDVQAQSYFPANIALWLLVSTISRKVNQLNFPIQALDTAKGMTSEIILLNTPDGRRKYTGWLRKINGTDRVIYTGFYMIERTPINDTNCIKVVFPMPDGNATVILKPVAGRTGELMLSSNGTEYGDAGFYRVQKLNNVLRVWRINSLQESFRVYIDEHEVLRCDHHVRFLGLPVISMRYRMEDNKL
jgi:hypothetical protein